MTYQDLVNYVINNADDIPTFPLTKAKPKWFHAYVEDGRIFVENSRGMQPSCSISGKRLLIEEHFEAMYDYYQRRLNGERVSKEVTHYDVCQVYWYGIIRAVSKNAQEYARS